MTGKELISEIKDLGGKSQFNTELEARAIYTAINRAVDEVNRLFPVTRTLRLPFYPVRPADYHKGITVHKGGEDTVFDASDIKSLAFAVSGTGSAILTADDVGRSFTFEWQDVCSELRLCRGIVEQLIGSNGKRIHLRFTGEYGYSIFDLTFYGELTSPLVEDVVTYSPWVEYELASDKYVGHKFLSFESSPVRCGDLELTSPRDYKIDGSRLYLRSELHGVYEVSYRVRPERLDADNEDIEIDVDPELHNLIAPRAAYYLYYMVDEEVADRCNIEYQRLYAQYMRIHKVRTPPRFRDVRGW